MRYLVIFFMILLVVVPGDGFSQGMDVVYAVGDDCTILKLEYGLWVPVDPGVVIGCYNFSQIWGSSEDNIYVTGCTNTLLHYDGVEWQGITIPAAEPGVEQLMAVGGTAYDNVFVGGLIDYGFSYERVAYHYDGAEWTSISDGTGIMIGILKIWAAPGGGLYATGRYYDHLTFQAYDRVMRFLDGTWSVELSESQDWDRDYIGIDGAAPSVPVVAGNWSEMFAGFGGGIWAKYGSSWSLITQSEDVSCGLYYPSYCPVWPVDWYGVCCVSLDDIWVVGESGRVLHWTPSGYIEYDTGFSGRLLDIWKSQSGYVYAIGDYGKIFCFDGGTWTEMSSNTTEILRAVWGVSEPPVATLLQDYSTDAGISGVTLRWSLSEIDYGVWFRVLKNKGESGSFVIEDGAGIDQDGLSFKYVDSEVEAGGSYRYIVEYTEGEQWKRLFETAQINVPGAAFGIKNNFPNPFNPSTKIIYSTSGAGHVTLKIYDVSGKLVKTIVDEVQGPGEHFAHWDGMNDRGNRAVSGTYFCRLISGKQAVTKKLLLMR